ncbi:transcriptional regulator family: GATA type zinc finger [Trichoderma aggressivum f. europaeum]|uniref:Transcriptional regulator family: GATA type zinc finger n=1 Tax=Trichoderma aggressivum f. europaeum TaxID=173218 RepID=A0AAE1IKH5_9HYPO|nr:transcriptional regulator family: GATA type zinc finger [Trichoderma aggressivum f. europaeum]
MDEDCIESGEPIYELASECEKLFSEQISRLKDEENLNGAKVVGEYQQQFSAWAAFLGVFAVPEMCLDRRLQRHADIQDLALRLLDIMKRNLTYLFEPENAFDEEGIEVSDSDGASSPQPQLHISIESLRGIEGAIERLHHLGGTIQLSSEASQATKLGKFAAKFDSTSFEGVARLAITSFYPDASPSLIEQLARAMTDMYQKFHYRRSRQLRLQPRPQLQLSTINEEPAPQIKATTWEADSPPVVVPPPINDIYKRLARPIVLSHLGARSHQSKESKPTSLDSQEFKKRFSQRKESSMKNKTKSIAASLVAYPLPSEASLNCDWCFSPLSGDEFKGDKWKMHLNEDFKPFLCLSEKCSEPLKRFATSRAWFSHMLEAHGQNWHREVHLPAWWSCPLCNSQETTYPKAQDLSEHISKLHSDVFTEQQIQVIVHQSRLRAPRPQDTCPLCCLSMNDEQNANQDGQLLKKAFSKPPNQGQQLAESSKRIKTEAGSIQLDHHSNTDTGSTEQEPPNSQIPGSQSLGQLNIETIAKHVAAHLQGMMLFSLRMMALDAVADKSTDDEALSGHTDNDLSRLGSNQHLSLPETQGILERINDLLVEKDSMDVDDSLVEDTIPDCEQDMNWQDFIPISEPPPEADTFLQQVIDSGAFQTREQVPSRIAAIRKTAENSPVLARPRTPPATIIIFPFRHDPGFIGHEAILNDLVDECSTRPARLALVGLGGIGKTQVAIELAYQLVKLAKMSVFWVHAENRSSINQSFQNIASNISPRGQADSVEAWLRHTSEWLSKERNGRWVMILDGANDHSIFDNELYLPKSQNGTIIVTTRRRDVAYRLTGNKHDVVEIGPLSVFEAVILLETKLGRKGKERFPKNGAASGLVKSLGLIPLAICRAAAYIQSMPLTSSPSGYTPEIASGFSSVAPNRPASPAPSSKHDSSTNLHAISDDPGESTATTCVNCFTQTTPIWRQNPEGQPLCNACGLFLKLHGVVRPLNLKTDVIKKQNRGSAKPLIENKDDTTTPLWRRNSDGQPLCNACGLFLKLHGVMRPIALKRDLMKKRNKASAKLLIKEKDDASSYLLVNDDPFIRPHQAEGAKTIPRNPLTDLSPKSSHHDGSTPPIVDSDEEDVTGDNPMYEDDEDDNIAAHGHSHTANNINDSDDIHLDDEMLYPSAEEVSAEETAEEGTALLHIEEQLVKLRDSEHEKLKLLGFEVSSPDRSGQVLESLFRTFKSSIADLRSQSSSAADLLSLMSCFDRRGIPKWLLRPFGRGHGAQFTDVSPSEDTLDEASGDLDVLLHQDLEILLNHCLITANGTKQMFEMHGLVQLSVKKNLDASQLQTFEQQFIKMLAMVFPRSIYPSWTTCEELFAHVQAAASYQPAHDLLEDFANLLHNGGRFARLQGRYEVAMQLAEQALIARQMAEQDDTKTLTLIGLILLDQGLYDKAEESLKQALDACKRRSPNKNNRRTVGGLNNKLALVYKAKGRWKDAMDIQLSVDFYRPDSLGLDYPIFLTSKSNLASMYRAQGRYMDAERTQKEAVDSYKNNFGPDHHLTLTGLNNLGSIYRLQGKLGEAETLQAQALVSLRMKLGGEHPDTLTCMNSLASTYRLQGRLYEAESLQEEALEMRKIKLGSDHPHTLASMNNLALIYLAQGKHQVAAKLQSEVVEICKTKLGPEHPHTLTSLNNIALIWKAQGRDADGRWKMDECLEARLRVLGQNHPYTISSRVSAESWWSSSRYARFPDIS